MKALGVTGGIGMGKSTTGRFLEEQGIPVIDTDLVARQVVQPGQPALELIRTRFGSGMIDDTGCLRRDRLAALVFADPEARRALEDITHPRIREVWTTQVEIWRDAGQPLVAVIIPLLFETAARGEFYRTICVGCSEVTQVERLLGRGWSSAHIRQRIASQWPAQKKMNSADFVIWSEGSLEGHERQLQRILAHVRCD